MFKIVSGFRQTVGWYLCDTAQSMGTVMDVIANSAVSDLIPGKLEPATGQFKGILLMDVTVAGPLFEDIVAGIPTTVVKAGCTVSIAEGEGQIVTDIVAGYGETGAITDSLAHDTELSVYLGKWRVAQQGEIVKGRYIGLWDGTSGQYHIEVKPY